MITTSIKSTEGHGFGALPDPRTEEQKAKDFTHHEFLDAALPVVWENKTTWNHYSVRDQDGSSSCVSQGTAKALEVLTGTVQSAHPIYARRSNFPSEGMWLQDAGTLAQTIGTTTEALCPSQKMDEAQMNVPVTVDSTVQVSNFFFVPITDIDSVAAAIAQYKQVVWCFQIDLSEWEQNTPTVVANPNIISGHCNCGVDYMLVNGVKVIVDEDSWGTVGGTIGTTGQRFITEDFMKARCTGIMVLVPWVAPTGPAPKYTFTKSLSSGMMNNADVKALQDILKYEGCMTSAVPSTGNFLQLTEQAVIALQEKYVAEILTPIGLTAGTGYVGVATLKFLNQKYS